MPAEGINYLPKDQLLSYEELLRITDIFSSMGVDKVRLTGGEPFARKDLIHFIFKLSQNADLEKISITTNGILTRPYLPQLKQYGIRDVNLSLDSLNRENFRKITRRDEFEKVWETLQVMLEQDFNVKINAVIMDGINDHEIIDLANLAVKYPVSVRFIEEMPFNGGRVNYNPIKWNYKAIYSQLKQEFTDITSIPAPANSTAQIYSFNKARGNVGIIAAHSRTFCGTCDRIRITSTGEMRTCLYGHDVLNLKHLLREGRSDSYIKEQIAQAVQKRARDGFEAEKLRGKKNPVRESMSMIEG
jgi:cyclic pyranopterin phosphate synthase